MSDNEKPRVGRNADQNHPDWKPVHFFWPGNNRFWWGGKIVSGPWEDLSAQCLVGLFVLGVSYLYYTRVIRTFPASYRLIGELIFGALLAFVVVAYFKVHLMDPGIIPRKYFFHVPGLIQRSELEIDILLHGEYPLDSAGSKPEDEQKEKTLLEKTDTLGEATIEGAKDPLNDSATQLSPSLAALREPRLRRQRSRGQDKTATGRVFCAICRIYRPIKAAHCSVCDNCVEVHAYHITFIGNCIGKRNFKFFVSFLGFTVAFLANFLVQYAIHYKHKKQEEEQNNSLNEARAHIPSGDSNYLAEAGMTSFTDLKEGFRILSLLVFGLFGVLIVIGVLIYLAILLYFVVR